jgi:acetolactate synthase I/II/III large subunit
MKYSDQIAAWLKELGYTHYFYVGGGNIMHLTESLSNYLQGIPVIHEVAAGIAAEYFNEISTNEKALALVTTGPGITNIVTAISGAWLESRELLVIGGQVKSSDLSRGKLRARGIQEVNGVELLSSITKKSVLIDLPINAETFCSHVRQSWEPRKGPVFLEIPLDVQAANVEAENVVSHTEHKLKKVSSGEIQKIIGLYDMSERPVLLIGGGVDYECAVRNGDALKKLSVPVMTTYNGADRCDSSNDNYFGRPNTWGRRSSNIIIQNADLIIAIGTRLGLQQTGFNWQEFGRNAKIIQIDIDKSELEKGHPNIHMGLDVDANDFIGKLLSRNLLGREDWLKKAQGIERKIPRVENINITGDEYISPYDFIVDLEKITKNDDVIIPCSSGSAFTLTMSLYKPKYGQRMLTNKQLASMGYGLSGAIGAAIAKKDKRTILIEGDGGFAQNLQEVGTAKINELNLKIFIFDDQGHASIRMTQINYFGGKYLGCDAASGLGLPNWLKLFDAWDVPVIEVNKDFINNKGFLEKFNADGVSVFVVKIDPKQTYYPKITSKITSNGSMESNPIDKMSPEMEI